MKKYIVLSIVLLFSLVSNANLNGNGYYRVVNNGTGNYIWVCDNTGSIRIATTSADMGAIQLWNGLDRSISEAASVLYFEEHGTDTWDIAGQGTSIYQIIAHYVHFSSATKDGLTLYEVSASEAGQTLYLYDGGGIGLGYNVLKTSGEVKNRKWRIEPIDVESDNYFGIKPTLTVGEKYYKPFYASFPYSLASTGMKAYYVSKVDGNIAVIKAIEDEVIPAKTPVLIECSSSEPTDNRLDLRTGNYAAIGSNLLKGVFFCNAFRPESKDAITEYDSKTMRVWNINAEGKLTLDTNTKDLYIDDWGDKNKRYLNSNTSYLTVAEGTPEELVIMTEEEYNDRVETITATAITLNKKKAELVIGETLQLSATVKPENATNKTVAWTTSNANIASVTEDGTVTAVGEGQATITATTTDGSNLSASCKITCVVDGIDDIITDGENVTYITIDGKKLDKAQKGLNIVRLSKGQTIKVIK